MKLKCLGSIICSLILNICLAQSFSELEADFNNYGSNRNYNEAYKTAKKMESFAIKNKSDTSVFFEKAYFYEFVSYTLLGNQDSLGPFYAIEFTKQVAKLTQAGCFYSCKSTLLDFIDFVKSISWDKTWLYCENIRCLAIIYLNEGNVSEAERLLKESISIYRINNERGLKYCWALLDYSKILDDSGRLLDAKKNLDECLYLYDSVGIKNESYCVVLNDLGLINIKLGNINEGINLLNKEYDIVKKGLSVNNNISIASLSNLGVIYLHELNDFEAGGILLKEAYDLDRKINFQKNENYVIVGQLGYYYAMIGDFINSEKYYLKSLDLRKKIFGLKSKEYASGLNNLGCFYSDLGNENSAKKNFNQALLIIKDLKGRINSEYATYLGNIAISNSHLGELTLAVENQVEVLSIYEKLFDKNHPSIALQKNNLSRSYFNIGNFELAEKSALESLKTYKNLYGRENSIIADCETNLGLIYQKEKRFKESEASLNSALILRKEKLGIYNNLYFASVWNLANFYNQTSNYSKANNLFKEAYSLKSDYFINNFNFLNLKEREILWNNKGFVFHELIDYATKSFGLYETNSVLAYNSILTSKALLMGASLDFNKSISNSKDNSIVKLFSDLKASRTYIAKYNSENNGTQELLSKMEQQTDSLDQLLSRKMSSYSDYKKSFLLTWKDVQSNLGIDEASVEFSRYYNDKDSSYNYIALILRAGDKYPQLIKLCSENELLKLSPEKELSEIYSLIWKPINEKLNGTKTIYYAPDGLLNNISFNALYQEKDGAKEYLIDKYSMQQLTSTRYLALGLKKKASETIETNIALFGGVNYNDFPNSKADTISNLSAEASFLYKNAIVNRGTEENNRAGISYLPGTKKEVENISGLLKSNNWNVTILEGKDASEDKIKSFSGINSRSIVHIATHGFAFPDKQENKHKSILAFEKGNIKYKTSDNPMIRSGLLFSGSNMTWQGKGDSLLKTTNEDGVLTAYELSQLSLQNTKLVVLSACETGKGAIQGSEGTFGLKRALKLAGVENMIVSLWDVPDNETMEMMTAFYTELSKTKKPISSFEFAQKTMRVKYPDDPQKWAGFVFIR